MHLTLLLGITITAGYTVYAQQSGFAEIGSCGDQTTNPITYGHDVNAGRGDDDPNDQTYEYQLNAACGSDITQTVSDLNACLGNNNGSLVYQPNGTFGGSCKNCGLAVWYYDPVQVPFTCDCQTMPAPKGQHWGEWKSTNIDLNKVYGWNGFSVSC